MPLRRYPKLPVYVVEDHNEALEWIYRAIGSKHLPFQDNVMIHFDSHPDLLIDQNLRETDVWDKKALLEGLSIENWILPGCYTGQFSKICWIKPPWSNQIKEGCYKIDIGQFEEHIRLGSDLYYFISDGLFVDKQKLKNVKKFQLDVATISQDCVSRRFFDHQGQEFILDIDLDYFSTKNPFLEMYENGGLYQKLKPVFSFKWTTDDQPYRESISISERRIVQLENLKKIFEHLDYHGTLEDLEIDIDETLRDSLNEIIQVVKCNYTEATFDWKMLLNAGMTCDETELPHHPSTAEEIDAMFEKMADFLRSLPFPPTIVTIARSSDDDYCPKDSVDDIQRKMLNLLEQEFKETEVRLVYEES